jgi:hypothetical protein
VRFIVMHKTSAYWEAGAIPGPHLIARVGALIGELAHAGVLLGAEGLRPTSEGMRLRFAGGTARIRDSSERGNELPAGFTIVRTESLDEAVEWASRQGRILGDVDIDVRPVTEPWDIGMAPKPPNVTTRRYMILRNATAATERDVAPSPAQQTGLARVAEEAARANVHVVTETMRPSARGRRYTNSKKGVTFVDGPFAETKELIGGYVIVSANSLDEAGQLANRYIDVVDAEEVDVRELA